MTVEQLMNPRWEVVLDYPDNTRNVGDIISIDEKKPKAWQDRHKAFFDRYPHIFKPLQWWERRELSEMPEYVKVVNGDNVRILKVISWSEDKKTFKAVFNSLIGENSAPTKGFLPATESDYHQFLTSKK